MEIRCSHCHRKLANAEFTFIEIKCPRCSTVNSLRVENSLIPERHRASFSSEKPHGTDTPRTITPPI
ncbi:Com family DNA-binding transcriptional regulator [Agitococcus lubricus]|uniref:Phage FluMu protein Com n=1 Tax=Agitococcus lubricus TaxID=1077255 RepID=A0A2T5J1G6_9GAMM|nr:phage FluMu protein Com [Agitococcus lubricus]